MIVVAFAAAALAAPPEFDGEVRLIGSLSPDVVVDADGTSTGQGPVLDLKDVPAALKRGIEAVKAGKRWVIDVIVAPEYVRRPLVEYG